MDQEKILGELQRLVQEQDAKTIVLGCTELSLFASRLSGLNKLIIDPLEIVAKKIVEQSFLNK